MLDCTPFVVTPWARFFASLMEFVTGLPTTDVVPFAVFSFGPKMLVKVLTAWPLSSGLVRRSLMVGALPRPLLGLAPSALVRVALIALPGAAEAGKVCWVPDRTVLSTSPKAMAPARSRTTGGVAMASAFDAASWITGWEG